VNENVFKSPAVIIGGVLLLVTGAACALGDGDGCSSPRPKPSVFAAGGSGIRLDAAPVAAAALPATGGFGTHLASCGG
jgi:hypothetical protein